MFVTVVLLSHILLFTCFSKPLTVNQEIPLSFKMIEAVVFQYLPRVLDDVIFPQNTPFISNGSLSFKPIRISNFNIDSKRSYIRREASSLAIQFIDVDVKFSGQVRVLGIEYFLTCSIEHANLQTKLSPADNANFLEISKLNFEHDLDTDYKCTSDKDENPWWIMRQAKAGLFNMGHSAITNAFYIGAPMLMNWLRILINTKLNNPELIASQHGSVSMRQSPHFLSDDVWVVPLSIQFSTDLIPKKLELSSSPKFLFEYDTLYKDYSIFVQPSLVYAIADVASIIAPLILTGHRLEDTSVSFLGTLVSMINSQVKNVRIPPHGIFLDFDGDKLNIQIPDLTLAVEGSLNVRPGLENDDELLDGTVTRKLKQKIFGRNLMRQKTVEVTLQRASIRLSVKLRTRKTSLQLKPDGLGVLKVGPDGSEYVGIQISNFHMDINKKDIHVRSSSFYTKFEQKMIQFGLRRSVIQKITEKIIQKSLTKMLMIKKVLRIPVPFVSESKQLVVQLDSPPIIRQSGMKVSVRLLSPKVSKKHS